MIPEDAWHEEVGQWVLTTLVSRLATAFQVVEVVTRQHVS